MGEKGETPRRRDDEAAAATGPGMKTMDHLRTDSISLATPASGPRDDQKVDLDLVKPPPSPLSVESTTPPKQTQPHANESHKNGQVVVDRDDDDEDCQAHERADNPMHGADTSTDTAAPHHNPAKAVQDQGDQAKTSASAPSAPRDHPGHIELRDPTGVQVKPGGETSVERDGSAVHESTDAGTDRIAEEAHGNVQVEVESTEMCQAESIEGERRSALVCRRSTTRADEDDQCTSTSDDNIPRAPPEPPPSLTSPDEPA